MPVCVFEDRGAVNFDPLTLTRPAFDLRCGAWTLLQRQQRAFAAAEVGVVVRSPLADLCRLQHSHCAVNDSDWLRRSPTILVNGRWLPPLEPIADLASPRLAFIGEEIAYAVLPAPGVADLAFDQIDQALAHLKQILPRCDAPGIIIAYPWDLVDNNAATLCEDIHAWPGDNNAKSSVQVVGPRDQLLVDPSAQIDPFVVADTRGGPVILDRNVQVHSFTRLEGPCYVGPESILLGTKLRGGSIGPLCRIGGEVECSIVHGYSNKYHDGFLGHSYVGEWVNLAAGTQTSDLRNDYGPIRVSINGQRISTGRNKIGSYFGDHTKTGLNTLLNCGTSVGAFCNLLPTGTYLPGAIPSFTLCSAGMTEQKELSQLLRIAAVVMGRRGCEMTNIHTTAYTHLFEATSELRRRLHADDAARRLRHGAQR